MKVFKNFQKLSAKTFKNFHWQFLKYLFFWLDPSVVSRTIENSYQATKIVIQKCTTNIIFITDNKFFLLFPLLACPSARHAMKQVVAAPMTLAANLRQPARNKPLHPGASGGPRGTLRDACKAPRCPRPPAPCTPPPAPPPPPPST